MRCPLIALLVFLFTSAPAWGQLPSTTACGLCREIDAIVARTPGTLTETIQGTFRDEVAGCDRPGCLLLVSGSWSELGGQPGPVDLVRQTLMAEGWQQDLQYSADGPDGTLLRFSKADVLCIIRGRWDGGDASDSTYVPSDVYQVTVLCSHLDAGLGPPPTGR